MDLEDMIAQEINRELRQHNIKQLIIDTVRAEVANLVQTSGVIDMVIRQRIEKIVLAQIDTQLKISTKVEYKQQNLGG